jgi:hypothetical protein
VISSFKPGQAGHPRGAPRHGWLRGGRWLLPWLAVVLVSASLAAVVNSSLSGSQAIGDAQRQEIVLTQTVIGLPPAMTDATAGAAAPEAPTVTEHAYCVESGELVELTLLSDGGARYSPTGAMVGSALSARGRTRC